MVDTASRPSDHTGDLSFASDTPHPLQHSSSEHRLSPAFGQDDSRPGWKAFAADEAPASTKQYDPYDVTADNDSHIGSTSLGTIDETAAATYDNTLAGPSSRQRTDSSDYEESPYSYPPTSEESTEAKRVQQNLERWGAEEKMRRKAHRTSKLAAARAPSVVGSYRASSGGSFHESSNGLGSGPSTELLTENAAASPGTPYSPHARKRVESADRRGSDGSTAGLARHALQRPSSVSSADSAQSFVSFNSDERPNRKLPPIGTRVPPRTSNGAPLSGVREEATSMRNPFVDPTETTDSAYSAKSRSKPTPTATRPIVTVGRASSTQRRALENGYKGKGKGKARSMPTIVATDTEPADETRGLRIRAGDPFIDDTEPSTTLHQGRLSDDVAMDVEGQRRRTGDLGEADLADGIKPSISRTSLSSSKFREHLEGEDDTPHKRTDERAEPYKKPWWTDWLCGCGTSYDDDDEQAGRTNPME